MRLELKRKNKFSLKKIINCREGAKGGKTVKYLRGYAPPPKKKVMANCKETW